MGETKAFSLWLRVLSGRWGTTPLLLEENLVHHFTSIEDLPQVVLQPFGGSNTDVVNPVPQALYNPPQDPRMVM